MQEKDLKKILCKCNNLEEFHLISCHDILMSGRLFELEEERKSLKQTLRHLKLLNLSQNRYLSDSLFIRFGNLTNDIHSLLLYGCNISFHKGLYKKFYPGAKFDNPSESVLTFRFILEFVRAHVKTIKLLDFSSTLIDGNALSLLAQIEGLQLETLNIQQCDQLTNSGVFDLSVNQKSLTSLNCSYCSRMTDQSLLAISINLNNLQRLYIRRCRALTDAGINELDKLTKLEVIDISECSTFITSKGIEDALCSKFNPCLKELYLGGLEIKENIIYLITRNLPNLTVLDLSACGNAVTNNAVQSICGKLRWLRELKLSLCYRITDAGITGIYHTHIEDDVEQLRASRNSGVHNNLEKEITQEDFEEHFKFGYFNTGISIARLRGLTVLKLQGCKLTDISLQIFKFIELKKLSISHCSGFTMLGFESLVKNCPAIESIDLEASKVVTDSVVLCLILNLPRLRVLKLEKCTSLTNVCLDFLLNFGTLLRYISFIGCMEVNDLNKINELGYKVRHLMHVM